jgi:hypothetical protein
MTNLEKLQKLHELKEQLDPNNPTAQEIIATMQDLELQTNGIERPPAELLERNEGNNNKWFLS